MRTSHYKHTQIGWMTGGSLGLAVVLVVFVLNHARLEGTLAVISALFLVLIALFATLTVEVDDRFLRFRFGVGLIRKSVALADVRHFSVVKNPWYYGWGIHGYRGGVLYNVSGFSAVELTLKNGRRLRVGTDEPEALNRALAVVLGEPAPLSLEEIACAKRSSRKALIAVSAVVLAVVASIAGLMYVQARPPTVTVDAKTFKVRSFVYGEEFAMRDITRVALVQCFPRIRQRTNGYSARGTLRGHFRLDELGDGQLFIEWGHPPYLLVKRGSDYVIVSFEDPDKTLRLYRELSRHWYSQKSRP